eukprot:3985794-Ditylum_brightwellii.AAC.1
MEKNTIKNTTKKTNTNTNTRTNTATDATTATTSSTVAIDTMATTTTTTTTTKMTTPKHQARKKQICTKCGRSVYILNRHLQGNCQGVGNANSLVALFKDEKTGRFI